ncbi:hypothetical protein GUITHDRAFT_122076 [Guillardia theta CCMP2712]|uniref:Uncharacterized protein n=1 Tax=Guillardia theta (strain CCMP2712) TaxID=905079 RepID=L1I798_GUITC|nr:hypothetical protein GUITHDRAFT_122076 [Guillardia theta CCMP2712]EKX31735.1 hypothetical protein GUITHDRAFT_122076 [Guillardia theta CCMP2712]|eukprot:XP_005818715.1 hypothetical protein GUITHDRAFT_122076 [Guillardia theta CCMP2712]
MVVVKKPMYPNHSQRGSNLGDPFVPHTYDNNKWNRIYGKKEDETEDDRIKLMESHSIFQFQSDLKYVNTIIAMVFYVLTVVLAAMSLSKDLASTKFPTSIVTYVIHPWNNMDKLDSTLQAWKNNTTPMQNVQTLWAWSSCDQYITTNNVPLQTDPYTFAQVSASNPVWMPGGCNCIAQVGHAMGTTWSPTQTTTPTKDDVKSMLEFCVYEGDMPYSYEPLHATYRPLYYFYAFMMISTLSIVMSNFLHDSGENTVRRMVAEGMASMGSNGTQSTIADDSIWKMFTRLVLFTFFIFGSTLAFTLSFLLKCNSCEMGLSSFNLGFPITFIIVISLILAIFFGPYIVSYVRNRNVKLALSTIVEAEHDRYNDYMKIVYRYANDEMRYRISDTLNAQAQLEHLWMDILLIPAMVMLAIGIVLTRQWTENGIIFYYSTLVMFYTVISTSGDWMTSHWTRSLRLSDDLKLETSSVYEYYQGYKDIISYAQIFVLIALVFTAVPSESITPYSYILFYNWFYFIFALFAIYMLPDIINDRVGLTMHTVTAIKQFVLNFLVLTLIITLVVTEFFRKDVLAYPNL